MTDEILKKIHISLPKTQQSSYHKAFAQCLFFYFFGLFK